MLTELLNLLEAKESGLSLSEISREMNAQPSAVMSMIEMLVHKGKLMEVGPDGKCCTSCGLESDCNLLKVRGKRYMTSKYPLQTAIISLQKEYICQTQSSQQT